MASQIQWRFDSFFNILFGPLTSRKSRHRITLCEVNPPARWIHLTKGPLCEGCSMPWPWGMITNELDIRHWRNGGLHSIGCPVPFYCFKNTILISLICSFSQIAIFYQIIILLVANYTSADAVMIDSPVKKDKKSLCSNRPEMHQPVYVSMTVTTMMTRRQMGTRGPSQ